MREDFVQFTNDSDYPFYIEMTGVSYCDGKYEIKRRNSRIYCFEYVIKGTGTVIEDGRIFTPSVGDVYILHRGRDHHYFPDSKNPWEKIWFNISGRLIDSLMEVYKLNRVNHIKNIDVLPLFLEFVENARAQKDKEEIFSNAALIFLKIVQKLSSHISSESEKPVLAIANSIKQALDNITNYRLNLDQLADALHCSKSYAIRVFKSTYGITPYAYLLNIKIEAAKVLLRDTGEPVAEIADRLGFCDSQYFSVYFKKCTGMTPSQYRKNMR